jgi:septum formation inhibitor MinC
LGALCASLGKCTGGDLSKALKCAVTHHLFETGSFDDFLRITFVEIVAQAQGSRTSRQPVTLLEESSLELMREKAEKEQTKAEERKRKEREVAELERRKEQEAEAARKKEAKEKSELSHQVAKAAREESRRRSLNAPISIAPAIVDPMSGSVAHPSTTAAATALVVFRPATTQAEAPPPVMIPVPTQPPPPSYVHPSSTSALNPDVSELKEMLGSMTQQMQQQQQRFEQQQQLLQQQQQRQHQFEQQQQQQQQQFQMQQHENIRTLMFAGQNLENRFAHQVAMQHNWFPSGQSLSQQLPGMNQGNQFANLGPMNQFSNHGLGLGGTQNPMQSSFVPPLSGHMPSSFGGPGPFGVTSSSSFPQIMNSQSILAAPYQGACAGFHIGNMMASTSSASADTIPNGAKEKRKKSKKHKKGAKKRKAEKEKKRKSKEKKKRHFAKSSSESSGSDSDSDSTVSSADTDS